MNIYVIGAGISMSAEYPLGIELSDEMDNFVRAYSTSFRLSLRDRLERPLFIVEHKL
jgi:hypothetical protein